MPVIRKNLITNDWVIFSPGRSKRPTDFHKTEKDNLDALKERPAYRDNCPFCRGNENPEDKEIFRTPSGKKWQVRVVENKFASPDRRVRPGKRHIHLHKEMDGFGIHDVLVDNPRHNTNHALMATIELEALMRAYLRRYTEIQSNDDVKHIVIFKNQGFAAGGSLEHPHSQIYGLPVMPFETQTRVNEVKKYHEFNDTCLMCDIMKEEREDKIRIVAENDCFTALSPYAALSPYHIWIVPKEHAPSFSMITTNQLPWLADMMKIVFYKFFFGLRNPDFNYVIQSLARSRREAEFFHWYVSIIPQVKRKGGIEYAGGMFVNPKMPEEAAEELRNVPDGQQFEYCALEDDMNGG
ncbi:MAG: galactose-1-phosphate uridylyltransferase [Spirochaetes bacterium GWF1_51_8]|nr:MAG: galactose-1-phosphate uridylyltransferase [Spirochaetes bacterium GWF1_51_8]